MCPWGSEQIWGGAGWGLEAVKDILSVQSPKPVWVLWAMLGFNAPTVSLPRHFGSSWQEAAAS